MNYNNIEKYNTRDVELSHISQHNENMITFANRINGTIFDYYHIESARWDEDNQELFIIVKLDPQTSNTLSDFGIQQYIDFKMRYNSEYFNAQVKKNVEKLNELSERFSKEQEQDMMETVSDYLKRVFDRMNTLEYSDGSRLSIDIDFIHDLLFEVGKI